MSNEKLTKLERLMLSNQYLILEKLDPECGDYYAEKRIVLEEGYELHYEDVYSNISSTVLSAEECREVIDILSMYRAITDSMKPEYDIQHYNLEFPGFDLNDEYEGKLVLYTRYFINTLNRFEELKYGEQKGNFNSHALKLSTYRKMLEKWDSIGREYSLTEEQILTILEA